MRASSRTFLIDKMEARAAVVMCVAAALIVIGVLTRALTGHFTLASHIPDTALVDAFPGAEDAIIRGNPVARVYPDARRQVPASEGGSWNAFVPMEMSRDFSVVAGDSQAPLDMAASMTGFVRLAHRSRAPPNHRSDADRAKPLARLPILTSFTGGANLPDSLHRTQ
jgi:hypothetical protein